MYHPNVNSNTGPESCSKARIRARKALHTLVAGESEPTTLATVPALAVIVDLGTLKSRGEHVYLHRADYVGYLIYSIVYSSLSTSLCIT